MSYNSSRNHLRGFGGPGVKDFVDCKSKVFPDYVYYQPRPSVIAGVCRLVNELCRFYKKKFQEWFYSLFVKAQEPLDFSEDFFDTVY